MSDKELIYKLKELFEDLHIKDRLTDMEMAELLDGIIEIVKEGGVNNGL